jgi:dTDP-4-dehydrorhamnose reductase
MLREKAPLKEPVLIVGAEGLIGSHLAADGRTMDLPIIGTILPTTPKSGTMISFDLTKEPWPDLPRCSAAVICAAITNQAHCKRDPDTSRALNVVQTVRLAKRLHSQGAFIVFISSNQVYDGSRPLQGADEPVSPRTEYGRQKAEAEAALLAMERCAIVRLTKVFPKQLAIIKSWSLAMEKGNVIHPFSDYLCSPIPVSCAVESIWKVLLSRQAGIWQVSADEDVSYAVIASCLAACRGYDV